MNHIIEYIKQKYDPCSIILYGSYADGTNNLNSDFDALVLSYNYEQFHDTSFVNGVQLDLLYIPSLILMRHMIATTSFKYSMGESLWTAMIAGKHSKPRSCHICKISLRSQEKKSPQA